MLFSFIMHHKRFLGLCELILLIQIALWLTPPVSELSAEADTASSTSKPTVVATSPARVASTKSVSPTTTVAKLSSSLSSTVSTTMTSTMATTTSTIAPTTTTLPTTTAPVPLGENCKKETPNPPCVSNAFCNETKLCQCNSTHYEDASSNTCRERIDAGKPCNSTNADDQCVTNAQCTDGTCQCEGDRYNNGGVCTTRISAGQGCSGVNQCVTNAQCISGTCQCDGDYYNNNGACATRINAGQGCSGVNQCVTNAQCTSGTCQCDGDYYNNNGACATRINAGQGCSGVNQCVTNAQCTSGTCQCDGDYYNNNGACATRINAGQGCSGVNQCVTNAQCTSGTCQCDGDYYNNNGACATRINAGQGCSGVNQCVTNAQCTSGTCQCDGDYYNNNGACATRINAGQGCSGVNQCVTNAQCTSGTCQCDGDYYNNNGACATRINAGQGCSGVNQCVTNAQCTSGTCQCDGDYYNNNGACATRINAGQGCSGVNQCVTNAQCISGTCQCDGDHYNNGGTCDTRIKAGQGCSNQNTDPNQCVTNAQCTSGTCQCDGDHYNNGGTCDTRKRYGEICTDDIQCFSSRLERCVQQTVGGTVRKCLCPPTAYRPTSGSQCIGVSSLKATNLRINGVHMESSIAVTWNNPTNFPSNAEYQATLSTGSTSSWGVTQHTFTGLDPGNSYTVNVTTRVPRNPDHTDIDPGNAEATTGFVPVYTKPAVPGPLMESPYPGPEVTIKFNRSNGHVDEYDVNLQTGESKRVISEKDGGVQSVMFSNLTPGAFYNVTIVAVITGPNPNVLSDPYQEKFRVKANSSGKVDNLKVEDAKGSRWLDVSWQKPTNPNGKMTGYLLVAQGPTGPCASAISVECTDCSEGMGDIQTQKLKKLVCTTSSNQTTSSTHLNSNTKFTGNLTGLLPDLSYKVQVYPYNAEGEGTVNQIMITTKEEAAEPLQYVTAVPGGVGQLNVTWIPGVRTGDTNYIVTWEEETSLNSNIFTLVDKTTITGYDNQMHQINGLLSYWKYRVSVQASAPLGASDNKTTNATTRSSEPGQVQRLQLTPDENDASKLVLTFECPKEKERNGNIVKFIYNSSADKSEFTTPREPKGDLTWDNDCVFNRDLVVSAQTEYTINVYAVTEGNLNGSISTQKVNISATPPLLKETPEEPLLTEKEGSSPSMHTVELEVSPRVVNTDQGIITLAGITVCVPPENDKTLCDQENRVEPLSDPRTLLTWKKFRDAGYVGRYRATPDEWHNTQFSGSNSERRRRSTTTDQITSYIIGENTTCDRLDQNVYCNGPLPSGTDFRIFIWACTSQGCTQAGPLRVATQQPEDTKPNIGAIVGGIVAAVAVIALVVVAVIMYRRYRPKDTSHRTVNLEDTLHSSTSHRTVNLEDTLHSRKSVSMILFPARVEVLHRNSNQYFLQEFQELLNKEKTFGYTSDVGNLDVNLVKNRYQHHLPYDHTRVKLYSRGDHGQDYINASYIKGARSPCDYLATQGPMVSTIPDFWKMVWEHRSPVIVMLSDLTENGQPKVDEYLPSSLNSVVQYGEVRVNLISASTLPHYTVRKMKLLVDKEQEREVTHYHLSGWTDQGSSQSLDDIADIVYIVTEETASSSGPVTVHCSEGTMRTCSFIALHSLQRHVTQHAVGEDMDVFTVLLNIVKCRPHMMQSERQYMFIHDVVRVMVDRKMRDGQGRSALYQNAGYRDSALYDSTYAYIPDGHVYDEIGARKKTQTSEL